MVYDCTVIWWYGIISFISNEQMLTHEKDDGSTVTVTPRLHVEISVDSKKSHFNAADKSSLTVEGSKFGVLCFTWTLINPLNSV